MSVGNSIQPLLSIVIANYNYGRFLKEAIKSIIQQDGFEKCELIIIDGGSTDNSVDVINKYADKIAYWVSEKDKGQSDAFNKGFSHARGILGCWVNADDVLLPGTLSAVLNQLKAAPDTEWITGGTIFTDADLRVWRARIGTGLTKGMYAWVGATVIGGPSSFFSLKRLREVGGFNADLHFTMDGDLWNKFFAAGMKIVHINRYFWGFRAHEMSKTSHSLRGQRSDAFKAEGAKAFTRRNFNIAQSRRAVMKLRLVKLFNGCIFRSAFDTIRMKGKTVFSP